MSQTFDTEGGPDVTTVSERGKVSHRPQRWVVEFSVKCEKATAFVLKLRIPWWVTGKAVITINAKRETVSAVDSAYHSIRRIWSDDRIRMELPKSLTTCPIADDPQLVAFMDGPVVLAGLCDEERTLYGDINDPSSILIPDAERVLNRWQSGYRVRNQESGMRFKPLYDVIDDPYTVYFPVKRRW